jgi:D-alanyl-lipoteichoic acid acyltransferase DltB (MBOAT superfamily)
VLFSSPAFFLFFAVYFGLHLVVPARHRVWLIIVGSTVFYAWWRVEYVWLPYALMATAYLGVMWIERAPDEAARRRRAGAVIAVLFVPLLFFKYTDFVYRDVLGPLFGWRGTLLNLPLPLGVSFVTFTLTAYVVDIFKRKFPGRQQAPTVLAYVLFFPHLIAGPILRPSELIPQLDRPRPARVGRLVVPLAIFTLGLVKKLVFADQIAQAVDGVYGLGPGVISGPAALLAIYGFSAQIYCDFSGYTDMAIGLALLLGVRLPTNFLRPYGAHSILDFWRRWHITLSHWLRDYLYIPLGGSRNGQIKEMRNVIVTMVLGGLWHGASWTFVIWGLLHGIGVATVHAVHRVLNVSRTLPRWLGVVVTFHFVTLAWVFFRAPSVAKAAQMLRAPFTGGGWGDALSFAGRNVFVLVLVAIFFAVHRFDDHRRVKVAVRYVRPEILWPALILLWVIAITVSQGSSAKFIYFDF